MTKFNYEVERQNALAEVFKRVAEGDLMEHRLRETLLANKDEIEFDPDDINIEHLGIEKATLMSARGESFEEVEFSEEDQAFKDFKESMTADDAPYEDVEVSSNYLRFTLKR